jgi:hypothetical protein
VLRWRGGPRRRRVLHVAGDGSCFYHALLCALLFEEGPRPLPQEPVRFDAASVNRVRDMLLRCLELSLDGAGETARQTLLAYCATAAPLEERLSFRGLECAPRYYATEAEVMLAARVFEACVEVRHPTGRVCFFPDLTSSLGRAPSGRRTLRLRCRDDHYDAVVTA